MGRTSPLACPGVLMLLATIVFWAGRKRYAHIPPGGLGFVREALQPRGIETIVARLVGLYFVRGGVSGLSTIRPAPRWVQQSEHMDLNLFGWSSCRRRCTPANPLLILLFMPLFSYVIFPAVEKVVRLTPLRKIGAGFVLTAFRFWSSPGSNGGSRPKSNAHRLVADFSPMC